MSGHQRAQSNLTMYGIKGRLEIFLTVTQTRECHLSLAFFCLEKSKNTHFYLSCQQTIGVVDLTFQGRVKLKQNVKENDREQGLTGKDVARKFAEEQAPARKKTQ